MVAPNGVACRESTGHSAEEDFGLGSSEADRADDDHLALIFERYVQALIEHGPGVRARFLAAVHRRFGHVLTKEQVLPEIVTAEWLVLHGTRTRHGSPDRR